jgi:ABC-type polysaccharide/polyol phosphate transport system ATPase subunit
MDRYEEDMALIDFDHVSKRYQVGTGRSSLRELIPNLFNRLTGGNGRKNERDIIWALEDVSLQVDRGETLGIIGRNGAGKTTVLKLLSRITHPTRGEIRIDGRTSALIELGAGFHPDLTGRENIYLNASILGLKRKEIDRRFEDIVAFAELAPFIDTPVKRYSSGMYARLGFSVAAHVDPDILLVDEVLSVGDVIFQQKCLRRIQEFQSAGKSIVFVSHNLVSVQKICSRVIWLERGRIASQGAPQEVVNDYLYQQMSTKIEATSSEPGAIPIRYGSGEAEIEAVHILDRTGHKRDFFDAGEEIVVQVDYCAHERIESANFLLVVTNGEGMKLSGTDLKRGRADPLSPIEAGKGSVQCRFGKLPLRPGVYFLIAVIEGWGRILDRQGMIGPFAIRNDAGEEYVDPWRYGIFDIEADWAADVDSQT